MLTRVEDWKRLGTYKRIKNTLVAIKNEMSIGNYPLSFEFDRMLSEVKGETLSRQQIMSAFKSLNFSLVQTYYKPTLYKTNATNSDIYDIFKAWKILNYTAKGKDPMCNVSGMSEKIMKRPVNLKPDFEFQKEEIMKQLKENKIGYNHNPPGWGPASKANSKIKKTDKKSQEKADEMSQDEVAGPS